MQNVGISISVSAKANAIGFRVCLSLESLKLRWSLRRNKTCCIRFYEIHDREEIPTSTTKAWNSGESWLQLLCKYDFKKSRFTTIWLSSIRRGISLHFKGCKSFCLLPQWGGHLQHVFSFILSPWVVVVLVIDELRGWCQLKCITGPEIRYQAPWHPVPSIITVRTKDQKDRY